MPAMKPQDQRAEETALTLAARQAQNQREREGEVAWAIYETDPVRFGALSESDLISIAQAAIFADEQWRSLHTA